MTAPRLLTVRKAAMALDVGKDTVYDLIAHGDLPVVRLPRKRGTWIDEDDLRDFVAANKRTPNRRLRVAR